MNNYRFNKLYHNVDNVIKEIRRYNGKEFDDENTNNFHPIPASKPIMKLIIDNIEKKRADIISYIKAERADIIIVKQTRDENQYKGSEGIFLFAGSGSRGNVAQGSPKGYPSGLFKYLCFYINKQYYEINFMRFFGKENLINCILQCIQFDCCHDSIYVNEGGICCPTNDKPSVNGNNIQKNENSNFSYNPDIAFDSEPKEIIKAFLKFVQEVEKSEKK